MNTSLTPDLNDIFAYIDAHSESFLARLVDYLRRPSVSAYGEGIGEVAEYIADVMRHMGLAVRIMPTSGWPMVFGEYNARPGAPTVLLYGIHLRNGFLRLLNLPFAMAVSMHAVWATTRASILHS